MIKSQVKKYFAIIKIKSCAKNILNSCQAFLFDSLLLFFNNFLFLPYTYLHLTVVICFTSILLINASCFWRLILVYLYFAHLLLILALWKCWIYAIDICDARYHVNNHFLLDHQIFKKLPPSIYLQFCGITGTVEKGQHRKKQENFKKGEVL